MARAAGKSGRQSPLSQQTQTVYLLAPQPRQATGAGLVLRAQASQLSPAARSSSPGLAGALGAAHVPAARRRRPLLCWGRGPRPVPRPCVKWTATAAGFVCRQRSHLGHCGGGHGESLEVRVRPFATRKRVTPKPGLTRPGPRQLQRKAVVLLWWLSRRHRYRAIRWLQQLQSLAQQPEVSDCDIKEFESQVSKTPPAPADKLQSMCCTEKEEPQPAQRADSA